MTWDDINEGDVVHKVQIDKNLNIILTEVIVFDVESVGSSVILFLSDESELTIHDSSGLAVKLSDYLTIFPTITDYIFYYPNEIQLFNMIREDFENTKALYDKSIMEVSENCMKLLDRKEELVNELQTKINDGVGFSDYIKLGNSIYADIVGRINRFTIIDIDLDNITVISLEGKSIVTLNAKKNRFGNRFFLKDNVTYYFTQTEAEVYKEISNIDHEFNNIQSRLEELTAESIRLEACLKNLENYGKNKKLEVSTTRK